MKTVKWFLIVAVLLICCAVVFAVCCGLILHKKRKKGTQTSIGILDLSNMLSSQKFIF